MVELVLRHELQEVVKLWLNLSTTRDGSFVLYTVEPLYKGQVGDRSFVLYTVEPLYKGQVNGDRSIVPCTVEPLYKGQVSLIERSSSSQR